MIKIAHESPKSYFESIQRETDYDYALVHLFEEDPQYLSMFKKAIAGGREVILDNSIFELGTAFELNRFMSWVQEIQPTWYIVPDVLEDSRGTIESMRNFLNSGWREKVPGCKCIGVVQGKTREDIMECYRFMVEEAKVDKVAISFNLSYYESIFPHPNKLVSWTMGRVAFIGDLMTNCPFFDPTVPMHLLGCALPVEGKFYNSISHSFIDSVDTSNPVVHGMKGISYDTSFGLVTKDPTKLHTLMDSPMTFRSWMDVKGNVKLFREMWNDDYIVAKA